jgi:type I restriction enzyme S subunit
MVPEGWSTTHLYKIADAISDGIHKTPQYVESSEYSFINGNNLRENRIVIDQNTKHVSNDEYVRHKKELNAHTILMSINGTIGNLAYYNNEKVVLGKSAAYIKLRKEVNRNYIYYVLSSSPVKNYLMSELTGSTIKNLSLRSIRNTKILLPSIQEQNKIAHILSTWDKTIETTGKLIENSKAQKKALMQQLVTGKWRFPEHQEKWTNYRLHEIADIIVSNVDKKAQGNELPVSLCNYTDVYYNDYITNDLPFMIASATQREISKFTLQKGDVLITKDSESPNDIAIPALVREELSGVLCGYHLAIVRPKPTLADGAFLNSLFSLKSVRHLFSTLANGATRFGLSIGSIENAIFTIPKLDEQKKIASILMAQDDKISNLASQRLYLIQQKQALMQQLLTGKRRVKVSKDYIATECFITSGN